MGLFQVTVIQDVARRDKKEFPVGVGVGGGRGGDQIVEERN